MRNMSFMLTTRQMKNRTKTVTRRLGWKFLKVGELVQACVKCQGLSKGERVEKLGVIRIVDVRQQRLAQIDKLDCEREGFPGMHPWHFAEMFCREMFCKPTTIVTRIEFEHVEVSP